VIVRKGRVEPETVVDVWPKARFKRQNGTASHALLETPRTSTVT
jgi:hypothetical protein